MDEKERRSPEPPQDWGRFPQTKRFGFCHHKVACPVSPLFVKVERKNRMRKTNKTWWRYLI